MKMKKFILIIVMLTAGALHDTSNGNGQSPAVCKACILLSSYFLKAYNAIGSYICVSDTVWHTIYWHWSSQ